MIGRVTQQTVQRSTLANLQTNLTRMSDLQNRLSGNKSITKPSDDPAGTASALALRSSLRQIDQQSRNIDDGLGWLTSADTALTTSLSTVGKARDLVIQGGNTGSLTPEARESLALEIEGLRDSLVSQANTTYLGRSVFAGTSSADRAVVAVTDATPRSYTTTNEPGATVERRVNADTTIRVDVDVTTAFGKDVPEHVGADGQTVPATSSVFATLDTIASLLRSPGGNPTDQLAALDGHRDAMLQQASGVGARHNQVLAAQSNAMAAKTELTAQLSGVEDADLAASIVELQMQEVAYQAALGATSRVLQPTLMDFLR